MSDRNKSTESLPELPDRKKTGGKHDLFEETEKETTDKKGETSKVAKGPQKPIVKKDKKPETGQQGSKMSPVPTTQKIQPWSFLFVSSSTSTKDLTLTTPNDNSINIQVCKKPSLNEESLSAKASTRLSPRYENLTFPSGPCCRICHSGVSREQLISPCLCKGSLGHVHRSCLEQWLNQAGRSSCELCFHQFDAIETRRYGCCESANVWLQHPRHRSHVQADFLICALLTVVTAGLMAVCLLGMRYFVIEGLKLGITHTWTHGAITIFLSLVVLGYIVTLYLLIRDQVLPWYRWWQNAVTVRLILEPLDCLQTTV